MNPDELGRLAIPSDPSVHGRRVAYVVSRMDMEEDFYERQIWLSEGGTNRRLTAGPNDLSPRWSPDGSRLTFLRAGKGKDARAQVAVLPADGGEARVVSDFSLGVEQIAWSPTSEWLVAVGVTWTEEWDGLEDEERSRRPKRISSVPYRFDNKGWMHDRRRHLWLIDPEGEKQPRCLTPGEFDEVFPAWSPDSGRIAFISDRDPQRGLIRGAEIWEVDIGTAECRMVVSRGMWAMPSYRPDGVLHVVGHESIDWPAVERLYRVDSDGTLVDLTGHLDRSPTSLVSGAPLVRWVRDDAFLGNEDSGSFGVIRVRPDGTVDHLVGDRRVVSGFDVSSDGYLAFTASEVDKLPEVYGLEEGVESRLTDLGVEGPALVGGHHFRVPSEGVEVDAWVYLPEGEDRVPVLVSIHGGPASQYGFGFFDEFQVYAGAGFGVVACNPRGSSGRGTDFLQAVVGDGWGVVDLADVTAVVDAALERFPRLDPERIGIQGGSYGGFLTAWTTARDHRYQSAVVERALLSYPSFAGTSDIGPIFPEAYTGADYPDGWAVWWEKSPLATAHLVTTPTLILHAEEDFRCPVEQAEQYFMALLRNGIDVEMLRFPREGHEMSRSGKPRHRLERFEAILEWHERHLVGNEAGA